MNDNNNNVPFNDLMPVTCTVVSALLKYPNIIQVLSLLLGLYNIANGYI